MNESQIKELLMQLDSMQKSLIRLHEENMALDRRLDKLEAIKKDSRINLLLIGMITSVMVGLRFSVSGTVGSVSFEGRKEDSTGAFSALMETLSALGFVGTAGAIGYQILKPEEKKDKHDS